MLFRSLFGIKSVFKWWSGKTIISTSVLKVETIPQPSMSVELLYKGGGGFNTTVENCKHEIEIEDFWKCIGMTSCHKGIGLFNQ